MAGKTIRVRNVGPKVFRQNRGKEGPIVRQVGEEFDVSPNSVESFPHQLRPVNVILAEERAAAIAERAAEAAREAAEQAQAEARGEADEAAAAQREAILASWRGEINQLSAEQLTAEITEAGEEVKGRVSDKQLRERVLEIRARSLEATEE